MRWLSGHSLRARATTDNCMDPGSIEVASTSTISLRQIATFRGIRVLAWHGEALYGCRGYQIVRVAAGKNASQWEPVAHFRPAWWRELTSRSRLTYRLVRDGFHALAVLDDGALVGAVPGAIVTRIRGDDEFQVTHRIRRGTRPLHTTATGSGRVYWGEYFDNPERGEVHIFASDDGGASWHVAYTFKAGAIRHIHNVVNDPWRKCLWILTGDEGSECRILRASENLSSVETVLEGKQQFRAVAAIPAEEGVYFSTDTPYESNHIYRLDSRGSLECVGNLSSSSIYGCRVMDALFFSTMAEPSAVNDDTHVNLTGSKNGRDWKTLSSWKKDWWPMRYFQYGNIILPDGHNSTHFLAATTIGVVESDLATTLWAVR